jgi:hypothetical protein
MIINELTQLLNNKLTALNDRKNAAYVNGDIALYEGTLQEIEEVQKILEKLQS